MIETITVFCGSSDRIHPDFYTAARQMGSAIAGRGLRLTYGAGKTGLMGAVADGALAAGGEVVGIMPGIFDTPALVHRGLTSIQVVDSMHQRKAMMAEMGDAFIALPGGLGTFDELFEILTWLQVGLHSKPVGLLNVRGYFEPFFALIQRAMDEGLIYEEHQNLFVSAAQPDRLLEKLHAYQLPEDLERWTSREE
jgi:uncharacterized protein (TIGR00730 family)